MFDPSIKHFSVFENENELSINDEVQGCRTLVLSVLLNESMRNYKFRNWSIEYSSQFHAFMNNF